MKKFLIIFFIFTSSMLLFGACSENNTTEIEQVGSINNTGDQIINTDKQKEARLESLEIGNIESATGTENKTYVMDDLISHNNKDDCWIIIDDKVYDMTKFINTHPGGKAILQGCGKDGTDLYNSKPGTSNDHSKNARSLLKDYYIGDLSDQ